jgi:hypothetical protein
MLQIVSLPLVLRKAGSKKIAGAGVSPCKASPYVRLDPAKRTRKHFEKGGWGRKRKNDQSSTLANDEMKIELRELGRHFAHQRIN